MTTNVALHIGHTRGHGTFHISDSLTKRMYAMLQRNGVDTNTSFGHGPSRKLKLVKRSFRLLGLSGFHSHGITRGVYLFPLARNVKDVIHKNRRPVWHDRPFADLAQFWHKRWAMPRSERTHAWREFESKKFFSMVKRMI